MFKKKIPVENDLYERARRFARDRGYSGLSEWVTDLMEEEMKRGQAEGPPDAQETDKIKDRLRGLGYIS